MESSASSLDVISRDKLTIFEIFLHIGPEGEEILKTAKLVHVVDRWQAFVVTIADETYSFIRTPFVDSGVCKIAKIPQLFGVRIKDFVVVLIELAVTEDGSLYSWILHDPDVLDFDHDSTDFALLGRLKEDADGINWDKSDLILTPHRVLGSLTGKKVRQVALSCERIVVLTMGGDVYEWVVSMGTGQQNAAKSGRGYRTI
ncbi:Protein pim1 [Folsomia candida]|uniref:Protein pim1 n=1 Tax=Folsomia candida TaxID=158441 RepID=A0A226D002_FOLCA|nr:Protein pim1 [Folsomia candida]